MKSARPWFVLVAGINGAGKSTFAQNPTTIREFCGLTGTPEDIEIINPDIITRKLLQAEPHLSLNDANERAANLCEERVLHLVDAGTHSFVIERERGPATRLGACRPCCGRTPGRSLPHLCEANHRDVTWEGLPR